MNAVTQLLSSDHRTDLEWKAVSTVSAIAGGVVTRKVLQAAWGAFSDGGEEPPLNPVDRRIPWSAALQWAITAGVVVGIGRVVSQRAAAAGWEKATGTAPPGLVD